MPLESRGVTKEISFIEWLVDQIGSPAFYLPLYSTISAAIVLLIVQRVGRKGAEGKRKVYGATYMLDTLYREFQSSCILLRQTVEPHVDAASRLLKGDEKLLETMFLVDEFQILNTPADQPDLLDADTKMLIGYDQVELVKLYETFHFLRDDTHLRTELNEFVAQHFRSRSAFGKLSSEQQRDILESYLDHLHRIQHQQQRLTAFIRYLAVPRLEQYLKSWRFMFFSSKTGVGLASKVRSLAEQFGDVVPGEEFFKKSVSGGIKNAL